MAGVLAVGFETYQPISGDLKFCVMAKNTGDVSLNECRVYLRDIKQTANAPSAQMGFPTLLTPPHEQGAGTGRLQPGHPGLLFDVLKYLSGNVWQIQTLVERPQLEVTLTAGYLIYLSFVATGLAPVNLTYVATTVGSTLNFIRNS